MSSLKNVPALTQKSKPSGEYHSFSFDEQADYRYSQALQCWVARQPLRVDDRVVRAAAGLGISLKWDDEGRICDITFTDARRLLGALGSKMLSPAEYWKAYREAQLAGDTEFVSELQSSHCAEWLDAVFRRRVDGAVFMSEHPPVDPQSGQLTCSESEQPVNQPYARPGWFHPDCNTEPETGLPIALDVRRAKGTPQWSAATWKYWSSFLIEREVAAIRGYVTSSGTPSLDLDIPVSAHEQALMLRECCEKLPEPALRPEILDTARSLAAKYSTTLATAPGMQNGDEHERLLQLAPECRFFISRYGEELRASSDRQSKRIKEMLVDMLGAMRLQAGYNADWTLARECKDAGSLLSGLAGQVEFSGLRAFMKQSRESLRSALEHKSPVVFVMGHLNPDTDTAVSAVMEAYRNSLWDKTTVYVPVLQAGRVPDEIARLLGPDLCEAFISTDEADYQQAHSSGQARWILVDHNSSPTQRFAQSIIDHHALSDVAARQDVTKTWEMLGSCAAMVALKYLGMGLELDSEMARLLHGATLMDTENRAVKKMTWRDSLIMDKLARHSGIADEGAFYQDLMSHLLNTDDARRLFERDYKQDWGIWGFAVAKAKNVFSADGQEQKPELLSRLMQLARENNKRANLALTLVKVVDYLEDNEKVNRERICLIFNEHAEPQFRAAMFEYVEHMIRHEFGEQAHVKRTQDAIEFWSTGDQLSRKIAAPELGELVNAFNSHYFSPELNLHVSREFLKADNSVRAAAAELGIELYEDEQGRVVNITYNEAKRLLEKLGMEMLSLPEYWKLQNEVRVRHDQQMAGHLVSPGFVEFFDTLVIGSELVHHPVRDMATEAGWTGERCTADVPEALPGLIYPEDINPETGLPLKVLGPEHYGDKRVWRYWSPDEPVAVPTRGHIFLLGQPALDLKFHPDDALQNLGIRPCLRKLPVPTASYLVKDGQLQVVIE